MRTWRGARGDACTCSPKAAGANTVPRWGSAACQIRCRSQCWHQGQVLYRCARLVLQRGSRPPAAAATSTRTRARTAASLSPCPAPLRSRSLPAVETAWAAGLGCGSPSGTVRTENLPRCVPVPPSAADDIVPATGSAPIQSRPCQGQDQVLGSARAHTRCRVPVASAVRRHGMARHGRVKRAC